jgi:hypothetical protein
VYTVRGVSGRADIYDFDVYAGVPLSPDVLDVPPSVAAAIPAIFRSSPLLRLDELVPDARFLE